ncbi:cadherin-23-like [Carcharodon carcharias]|uniref:cadherin-23-like n=1 Tax=Carcharodon carcharias TaxID=13397 RepID=UPI001B7DCBAD|nr:cadherin-23-like [Carcharodon carcharias]
MVHCLNRHLSQRPVLYLILIFVSGSVCVKIRYSIPEELDAGTVVGNIATDLRLDAKQMLGRRFRVVSEGKKQYLDVNLNTGALIIEEKMDKEQLCEDGLSCVLVFEAVIENPLKLYHLEIEILDINDNAPAFKASELNIEIPELQPAGTSFPLQSAIDPDAGTNSVRFYQLSSSEYFTLKTHSENEKTEIPELVLERPLDREQQAVHQLTLTAFDGGSPEKSGTTQIKINVLDVNDNAPSCEQNIYQTTTAENIPKNTLIVKVTAIDLDEGLNGEIIYAFSEQTPDKVREVFSLDSTTGEIRVTGILDFEEAENYQISVQAKDRGARSLSVYCKVLIKVTDVNDNCPEIVITTTSSSIPEDAAVDTAAALFRVTDRDSDKKANIYCRITRDIPFRLNSSFNNYYTLVTSGHLDREKVPEYNITFVCTDTGSPPLSANKTIRIQVSDINDNPPLFTQPSFTMYVSENNVIGASIGSVSAFDPDFKQNAELSYSILDSLIHGFPASTLISINAASGVMLAQRSFDFEQLKKIQAHVQVKDFGSPPLSSNVTVNVIIVDQNDNAPVIVSPLPVKGSSAEDTMPRSAEPGYLVAKVTSTDADTGLNAQMFYQLRQPTDESLFTVASETGEIWTIRRFGHKDSLRQKIIILVKDNGTPSLSSTVTINVSVQDDITENTSNIGTLGNAGPWKYDLKFYLMLVFGSISILLLVAIVILAINVLRGRNGSSSYSCCWQPPYLSRKSSHHGIQKASASLQIPSNYTEVYESGTGQQTFDYGARQGCALTDFTFLQLQGLAGPKFDIKNGACHPSEYRKASNSTNKDTAKFQEVLTSYSQFIGDSGSYIRSTFTRMVHWLNRYLLQWLVLYLILIFVSGSVCAKIRYSIPEELEVGAIVGNIATDLVLDVKQLLGRRFRVVSGDKKQYLGVNLNTGALIIKEKMDREQLCENGLSCVLVLEAVIENPLKLYRVEIEILDINDNAPVFRTSELNIEIPESQPAGTSFPLQSAIDPDAGTNRVRSYQLSSSDYFTLKIQSESEQSDAPELVLERPLDREKQATHQLTLTALDGGSPVKSGTTQIKINVLDANDNAPSCEQNIYQTTAAENIAKNTIIVKVSAIDLDEGLNGEIIYAFSDQTPDKVREVFSLDSTTGEIRVTGNLDFEEADNYQISVRAKDRGARSLSVYCKVLIKVTDVNDNCPEIVITTTSSSIPEDAAEDTAVALFRVTDRDSDKKANIYCRITRDFPFRLNSSFNNYYTLVTSGHLDREKVPEYNITFVCTDTGSPPLSANKTIRIQVSDINDNPPRFTQPSFTMYLSENNVIGASIGSVSAFDPDFKQNAELSYSILDSLIHGFPASTLVSINAASGVMFAQRSFDFEQLKKIQAHVQVKDFGSPPLSSNVTVNVIIVDQNDNAPVIVSPLPVKGSSAEDTMPRSAEPGYLVAKVTATDADSGLNAQIFYQLRQPTDESLFTVASETGEIWTIRRFGHKDSLRQKIVILVKDTGTPSLSSTVTINVSVQDDDITENASNIGTLDNAGPWKYDLKFYLMLVFGSTSILLLVAIVILANKVRRGRNGINSYSCCWHPPYFSRKNSLHGIQKASASLQIPPNYTEVYESGTGQQTFDYGARQGCALNDFTFLQLQGVAAPKIDIKNGRCHPSEYRKASNSLNKDTAKFQERMNSLLYSRGLQWPVYYVILVCVSYSVCENIHYTIPEELELGDFVGNIASDLGLDTKQLVARGFRIASENKIQYVDVDLKTGILFIKETIDREELCEQSFACVLMLEAVLENPLQLYRVQIEILDVNDNAPVFQRKEVNIEISELMPAGTTFPLQSAIDPDVGPNKVRSYQLSPNEYFILKSQSDSEITGIPELVLERPLDREQQPTHRLTLTAFDGGIPQKFGTTQINITVLDANDNAPVCERNVYHVTTAENVRKNTLIVKVTAVDMDEGLNGEVIYSFSDHTPDRVREIFSLDSLNGEIRVTGIVDFEEADNYQILIQAKDRGKHQVPAYCKVLIKVTDVNDNYPQIITTSTSNGVQENAPPNTAVALFRVTDRDSENREKVHCRIARDIPFMLNISFNNYYTLVTHGEIDRENLPEYNITIICTDTGSPPLSTTKIIRVQVSDINDNQPRFTQPSYTMYVTENNVIGSSIGSVSAFDPDSNENAELSYSIVDSLINGLPASSLVSINAADGVIFAQRSFDFEQVRTLEVHVKVKDAGSPPLSSNVLVNVIIVDQNDNVPVIASPLPREGSIVEETIPRSADSGYLVAKLTATDADSGLNGQLSYQLRQPTEDSLFTVAPETGEIWTIRRFGLKDSFRQRIMILVRDNGTPSLSVTVTINVSVQDDTTENASNIGTLGNSEPWQSDLKLYLIICFGITSFLLLVAIVILSLKVYKGRNEAISYCCCWKDSLLGIQSASVNLQMPPKYTEGYDRETLPQPFRYDVCQDSTTNDFMFLQLHGVTAPMFDIKSGSCVAAEHEKASNVTNSKNTEFHQIYGNRQRDLEQSSIERCPSGQYGIGLFTSDKSEVGPDPRRIVEIHSRAL